MNGQPIFMNTFDVPNTILNTPLYWPTESSIPSYSVENIIFTLQGKKLRHREVKGLPVVTQIVYT
jgi:hypothetical protein